MEEHLALRGYQAGQYSIRATQPIEFIQEGNTWYGRIRGAQSQVIIRDNHVVVQDLRGESTRLVYDSKFWGDVVLDDLEVRGTKETIDVIVRKAYNPLCTD